MLRYLFAILVVVGVLVAAFYFVDQLPETAPASTRTIIPNWDITATRTDIPQYPTSTLTPEPTRTPEKTMQARKDITW